jgi:hypothetical protein
VGWQPAKARWSIVIIVLFGLVPTFSCSQAVGEPSADASVAIAAVYFSALAEGEPDYGWSLLHPFVQEAWSDYESYEEAISPIKFDASAVTVTRGLRCHDFAICEVCLHVPGGPSSLPDLLLSTDGKVLDGVIFHVPPLDCGNAVVGVIPGLLAWDAKGVNAAYP